jgi:hypothetical protein
VKQHSQPGRFSARELAANRAGHITIGQRFKLLGGVAALIALGGIGLIICIAIGPNLIAAFQDLGVIGGILVTLFFLLCLVMAVAGGFGAAMVLGDTVMGKVGSVTGEPVVKREGVTTNALALPLPSSYTYPGQYKYKVEVGDKEFDVEPKDLDLLARDGVRVRAYFAAYSGELLSLESVEPAG